MNNITGFVYIWFDSYRKFYYIGSHYGSLNDGYLGSSVVFKRAYKKRPDYFKRRILHKHTGNRKTLLDKEQYYLNMIKLNELYSNDNIDNNTCKYYNMKPIASGLSGKYASELRKKFLQTERGKQWLEEQKQRYYANPPCKKGNIPWNKGKKCPQISQALKGKSYITEEGRERKRKKTRQLWEQGVFDNRPKQTPESIQKRIETNRQNGFKQTDKQKQKAAEANQKRWVIITPTGEVLHITNLSNFCRENNLKHAASNLVSRGKYKGYQAIREDKYYRQ